eukprot:9482775-Pyramimonas_sp.AAC.1
MHLNVDLFKGGEPEGFAFAQGLAEKLANGKTTKEGIAEEKKNFMAKVTGESTGGADKSTGGGTDVGGSDKTTGAGSSDRSTGMKRPAAALKRPAASPSSSAPAPAAAPAVSTAPVE